VRKIIHATTDEEAQALWIGGKRTFAVRLALSLEDAPQNHDIGSEYNTFLNDIDDLKKQGEGHHFVIYEIKSDGTVAAIDPHRIQIRSEPTDLPLKDHFRGWLTGRIKELEGNAGRTRAAAGSVGRTPGATKEVVHELELTAFHVLMGGRELARTAAAQAWPRPRHHRGRS
jgi:hypothetical protein